MTAASFIERWGAVARFADTDVNGVILDCTNLFPPIDTAEGLSRWADCSNEEFLFEIATKRFVFDGSKIAALRERVGNGLHPGDFYEKDPFRLKAKKMAIAVVGGQSSCSSGKGRSHQGPAKYGFSLVKGKANHPMEDYHVAKFVQIQGHVLGLFAIYDGHLGDSVPAYLQKNLFNNILKDEEFWTDTNKSILKAYEKTDQAILSHSPDLGSGGSTAVTAILINGQKLWIANVGDSRAVLSRRGKAIQMTTDHEPNTERGDVARVNGQLAVSRAFGDKNLKSHLRSDPDIQNTVIDSDADVLILASDGLWKVMSNQEAVDIARKTKDPQRAAKQLAAGALNKGSKDDISCIVVRFNG
ncbi:hypothetical protein GH714_027122 [Hevea brasiliensis]|uniref:protein-serine/threonine phosphatase n=1 Tax=Hevea brasiliensis TaxID=3981 RepID=A0A6A6N2B7_HEVBR|nr:hypothetical protein GH714_027122 [Hevea brasiliensis]